MYKIYFYLLIWFSGIGVYGQRGMYSPSFLSAASIVYLKGNSELYLINAEVRFYANFKVKYVPPVKGEYREEFSMFRPELENGQGEVLMKNGSSEYRIFYKPMEGWLDDKKRAEAFNKGVGRAMLWMLGGK